MAAPRAAVLGLPSLTLALSLTVTLSLAPPPPQARVACLGEALFDCIATTASSPTRPAEELEASGAFKKLPGGAPANAAVALARLGTPAAFLGGVGGDADGTELLELMRERGVDCRGAGVLTEACTRRVMVNVDADGDRHFAGFGARPVSSADFADTAPNPDLEPDAAAVVAAADVLLTGTLGLAAPKSAGFARRAAAAARRAGRDVMVDVNWRPVFWDGAEAAARDTILKYVRDTATMVKVTDEEAAWLFPDEISPEAALEAPERLLGDDFFPGAELVLVTAGEYGSAGARRGGARGHRQAAFDVDAVETTGAGDAFSAGMLHYLLTMGGDDLAEGLRFASAVGALVTTKYGAWSQPQFDEVISFVGKAT